MGAQKYVSTKWSADLAYAVGLIASDGNLPKGKSSVYMTSKDLDLILTFRDCLKLKTKIGRKGRGGSKEKNYYTLQFGSKNFYQFLLDIGITPAKSKTIGAVQIPDEHFKDFIRGCIDGDGCIRCFKHPESRQLQLRVSLYSASIVFLTWVKNRLAEDAGVMSGWIETKDGEFGLVYGKRDSVRLLAFMYYDKDVPRLERKYLIARQFMGE